MESYSGGDACVETVDGKDIDIQVLYEYGMVGYGDSQSCLYLS